MWTQWLSSARTKGGPSRSLCFSSLWSTDHSCDHKGCTSRLLLCFLWILFSMTWTFTNDILLKHDSLKLDTSVISVLRRWDRKVTKFEDHLNYIGCPCLKKKSNLFYQFNKYLFRTCCVYLLYDSPESIFNQSPPSQTESHWSWLIGYCCWPTSFRDPVSASVLRLQAWVQSLTSYMDAGSPDSDLHVCPVGA